MLALVAASLVSTPATGAPKPIPNAVEGGQVEVKAARGTSVEVTPSDDVWVYPHASDGAHDEAMRVWGSGGIAAAASGADAEDFSYGYLRFDVKGGPQGTKLVSATLEITNVPNAKWSAALAKEYPIEVRPLTTDFTEKTWVPTDVLKVYPDPKVVYGEGVGAFQGGDAPTRIAIELKSPEFLKSVQPMQPLLLALTSKVDAAATEGLVYKIYSKDVRDAASRPKLVLRYE